MIYLDADERRTLTGYKRSADQIRWLERNGVPHSVNAKGEPVVRKDMDKTVIAEPELGHVP